VPFVAGHRASPLADNGIVDIRTARELMVDQLGVRRIDNRQTCLPGSQTEIYIIVDHRMRLVEPAESVEYVAAH
jgi:hypothetical protein